MSDEPGQAEDGRKHNAEIAELFNHVTEMLNDSFFEKALDIAKEYNLPEDGIKLSKFFGSLPSALASLFIGGYKDGVNGVSNASFSTAISMGLGPEVGIPYGMLLDYLSELSRKYKIGEKVFDSANSQDLEQHSEFLALMQNSFPRADGKAIDFQVRKVRDGSGNVIGYISTGEDKDTNTRVVSLYTPNKSLTRKVSYNTDKGVITISGSGINITSDSQSGNMSTTLDWEPGRTVEMDENGAVQYGGCTLKLDDNPFGGTTVSCDGDKYSIKPGATIGQDGMYVVVSNENGDGLPNMLLTRVGGYVLNINKNTNEAALQPFGETIYHKTDTASYRNAEEWLREKGGWNPVPKPRPKGGYNQPGKEAGSGNQSGSQANPVSGGTSGAPVSGAADNAHAVVDASVNGLSQLTAADKFKQDTLPTGLSFNSDGSGATTTTNPDGSKTTTPFGSVLGAVKLADFFGTLPEVVSSDPFRFALHYTAMASQQASQLQGQVAAGGLAADPGVKGASSNLQTRALTLARKLPMWHLPRKAREARRQMRAVLYLALPAQQLRLRENRYKRIRMPVFNRRAKPAQRKRWPKCPDYDRI